MERRPVERPPMEWVEKLFDCMSQFYGKRWEKRFDKFMPKDLAKTLWQSALVGCTYDEIKRALVLLKRSSQDPATEPPLHMEFYRYAKGTGKPAYRSAEDIHPKGDPEVARKALDDIRAKLQ